MLEKQIHAWLIHSVGGHQKDVKGVSQTTLSKMKSGNSGITTKTLSKIFEANNLVANIVIESQTGQTTTLKF